MGWHARDIPDQTGRVAVVTGASGGLGLETVRELARRGGLVIMAVRDPAKGMRVRGAILAEVPTAMLEVRHLELSSLASVHSFAVDLVRDHPRADLLVNSAGVMATPPRWTADGFEWQVGVNHLAHFALTAALMPALRRSPAARVVTVTSAAALLGRPLRRDRLWLATRYSPWLAYGDSKLANYRFGLELARRLELEGVAVASLVAHPGLSHTGLQSATVRAGGAGLMGRAGEAAARWLGMPPAIGALSQLRAATDPGARNGDSYGPRWVMSGAPVRLPTLSAWLSQEQVARMWTASEVATGTDYRVTLAPPPP
jgi:NAD(P)-dependent dehydrogenase (short-subunit alcohol dehydrogenase family)